MAETNHGVTEISCALALVLFASAAVAQNTPATVAHPAATEARVAAPAPAAPAASTLEPSPAAPAKISYVGGQLSIEASDAPLADVLTKVSALTGVKIEIPAGASSERLPIVKLGPGPAREILASLLSGSSLDYLILASATDPGGIQDVVLAPREKKGSGGNAAEPAARPSRSPSTRAVASASRGEETPEPDSLVPAQPDAAAAETSSVTPATPPPDLRGGPQSGLSPAALSNQSGLTTAGAMRPPATLDQQSINQQLLQMYQGRMQMGQQVHPVAPPPPPSSPTNP